MGPVTSAVPPVDSAVKDAVNSAASSEVFAKHRAPEGAENRNERNRKKEDVIVPGKLFGG